MAERNPEVDAYLERATTWQGEMKALREIALECGLDEQIKWGKPCYSLDGANVVILQAFKPHLALMFFKGAVLQDPEKMLVSQGKNTQSAKRLEFTSVEQIQNLGAVVRAYIHEAIEAEKAGLKVDFSAKHELVYPDELAAAFDANPALLKAFESLTPGRQRQYVMHFSDAKQSKTRTRRIEKCAPQILAGKGLTDR